jgi:hypothetical protein
MTKTATTPVVLDPRAVAGWRLARQRLAPPAPRGRLGAVATDLVGVQAQVASSAALSMAIRVANGRIDAVPRALADRRLVRSWAMRGTLHLFAADDFPTITAALRNRETWRNPVWLRYFDTTVAEVEKLTQVIGDILDDGRPRNRAQLADELGSRLTDRHAAHIRGSWGTFLKPAAYRGYLCQAAGEGAGTTFVRPSRWLGRWRNEDPQAALRAVVRRYLAAYGPATVAEIARWWGNQPKLIRPLVREMSDELTEVTVGDARGFVLREDVETIRNGDSPPPVRLLGAFDPLIVGAGLRDGFIPRAQLGRVSRTAGWISPVVLVDGLVGGLWQSRTQRGRLIVRVELFGASNGRRRALRADVDRLGEALGTPASLELGAVEYTARKVAGDAAEAATVAAADG